MTGYTLATRDGGSTLLSGTGVDILRRRLRGPLLSPRDAGFAEATRLWNGMVHKRPALAAQPTGPADVAAAVSFAREHDLALSVRGGGHNIAGTALADGGLALDLSRLRDVRVDATARLATVGAGCLLGEVDRATQGHGLAVPLGFISEVGVAGLTLGGGLGYLTRRFGWTVDCLEEVEIVTADGEVRTASRHHHPDLFWAVRGAGANLGVVTRFTFRLHEVGPTVYGGLIAWPFQRAEQVLQAYRELTARAPRELAVWLVLMHAPPAPFVPPEWHGRKICAMAVCYSGDAREADAVLAPLRALGAPVFDLLRPQPYVEVQSYLDATEPRGLHHYWKTEYLADLGDDLLEAVREVFGGCEAPEGEIGILHVGGALNERAEDDGAVGNRDARFAIGVKAMWEPGAPGGDAALRWVRAGWERLRPYSTGRSYINFQTSDEDEERVRATYGANLPRLLEVKARYDPHNLFRSNRNLRLPRAVPRTPAQPPPGGARG